MNSSNSSKRHVAAEEQLLLHEMHHKNNVSVVPSKQNSTTYGVDISYEHSSNVGLLIFNFSFSSSMSREIKIEVSPVITGPSDPTVEFDDENITVKRIPAVYSNPSKAGYFRPWRFTQAERSGTSKIFYAKTTKFRIILDVGQFGQDLKIDVVGSQIEVEANHEMVPDKLGEASRWMKRKYKVPPDVKLDTVTSQLKAKGSLIINAERDLEDSLGENYEKVFRQQSADRKFAEPVHLTPAWEEKNLPNDVLNFKNVTMEQAELETNPPKDRFLFVYFIILIHGMGTLMPWNMFITAQTFVEVNISALLDLAKGRDELPNRGMGHVHLVLKSTVGGFRVIVGSVSTFQCPNLSGIFTVVINILSRIMAPALKTAAMYYFIVALLVLFICFDTYFVLPLLPGPNKLFIPVLMRAAFIPLFIFCNYKTESLRTLPIYITNDYVYWGITIAFAFTSGYFSSLAMMYCGKTVAPQHSSIAGMFGAACLVTGIISGLMVAFVFPPLINKLV
ncbi:hypothetical protein V9T40_003012 [Parthenolecanium corni]|uniref:SHSP domain-containing protein n=1 Tax=Parthenolecanium corni TaxID=536013 RepID=A0AAN9TRY6_9HEMI